MQTAQSYGVFALQFPQLLLTGRSGISLRARFQLRQRLLADRFNFLIQRLQLLFADALDLFTEILFQLILFI